MNRRLVAGTVAAFALLVCATLTARAKEGAESSAKTAPALTVAQIVEQNAIARGGASAWRKVETMAWSGRVETPNAGRPQLPFVLEQKRPNKTRFEIMVDTQKSLRIFDGNEGWKLKPTSSGRPEAVPYTATEAEYAREAQVIDGPLMDYAARGYPVTFEAMDKVEGRTAYRLSARMPSGTMQTLWVDSQTFLELRLDRVSRDGAGRPFVVSVYFRNYKSVEGLQIPLTLETRVGGNTNPGASDKLVIERVALNPTLEDHVFSKPRPQGLHHGAIVDTRAALPHGWAAPRRAGTVAQ